MPLKLQLLKKFKRFCEIFHFNLEYHIIGVINILKYQRTTLDL